MMFLPHSQNFSVQWPGSRLVPDWTVTSSQLQGNMAMTSDTSSEAQIRHHFAALVLDHIGTADALERLLGIFVTEGGRSLIIGFCGGRILRPAAALGVERAHPFPRPPMILPAALFAQSARPPLI